ncbi:tubulin monoglycylase TTLL3 isoform X1 [Lates calcarifer]|uniref:Tubulin monoglycylase TTLL3 isoform X1 n=1 Tax=Lates calcarifer TaxID=8187 RepID=A0AAJ7PQQ1_LATCA|nr:tubulin monoglycylase TTLL3 isoform X1 [Lates calcarifer]XP_050930499.1 tubulin monoglycylase TTLL3 isoform X1 [Lates calcarifer]
MQQMPVLQSTVAPVEGRLHRSVPSLPAIKPDRLKTAKALVEKAVKLRKVFSVQGPYPVIRAALWARGWVERRLPHSVQTAPHCHGDEDEDGDDGDVSADVTERVDEGEKEENRDDMYDLMSRQVRNETTYFYWTTRRDYIDCHCLRNDQMTNHYANAGTFTTKVGLCVNLRNLQWFDTADPDTFFPRCYRLGAEDEKHAFIEDFRRTACTSLLQYVVETSRWRREGEEVKEQKAKDSISEKLDNAEHRSVGPEMIDTALHACQEFLSVLEHGDIDVTVETPPAVEEQQWAEFLQDYYMVVHEGASIRGSSVFVERCQAMLSRLQEACPQLDTDGLNNIWIIKPGAKSRGRGIMCMNRLDEILALVDTDRAITKESKWVVQKYLERPLLVHGTKFDLRQWFLVTDWNPLTVWFYRECYLRFSTQPYSTKTLDSSVHLCNNSIQKHFQPSRDRHPGVPEDNMWSCSQFRDFLQQQGCGAQWESVVVPGMQQAVVRALQTAQDLVEPRKASFELYGADFMLGRDLRPWLLEINASPTMACSTAVTARLCPAVQLDTLRVVLDWRTGASAYTGGFQLIYKQAAVEVPHYVGVNLLVEGAPIRRSRPLLNRQTVISNALLTIQFPSDQTSSEEVETTHKPSGQKPHAGAAFRHSGKENRAVGEKKRQLTSTSPKRAREGRTDIQNTSYARRSCRSLVSEQPLVVHTEPQRKARRLGLSLGANGATLVPRSLSFSLSPPHCVPHGKTQPSPGHGSSHISRSFLPQTAFEPQHRTSTRVFPSLQGPLPTVEVLSLRPNIVTGTVACRNPNLSFHSSLQTNHLFIRSHKQSMDKYKGDRAEEHKY